MATLTRDPRRSSRSRDFTTVIRVLEAHVACVTATRAAAPGLVAYALASAGRAMLATLARGERIDLDSVAEALRCRKDIPSLAGAALAAVTRTAQHAGHPQRAQLVAALEAQPDELALWIVGELAVLSGRIGGLRPGRMTRAALRSALRTFAEVQGLPGEADEDGWGEDGDA